MSEAIRQWEKSAASGNAMAQYNLGACYDFGNGVQKDISKAVKYYELAARQKLPPAQYNLASCYYNGEGVKKDKVLALAWYLCAWYCGDERAKVVSGRLMGELSDDENSKAADMAKEFLGAMQK